MRKGITYVDAREIEGVVTRLLGGTMVELQAAGKVKVQKGFLQVVLAQGRKLYVGLTANVGRVDLSGYEMPAEFNGVTRLVKDDQFGSVKEQVDFEHGTAAEILQVIEACATHGISLGDAPKALKAAKAKGPKMPKAQGWSFVAKTAAETEAEDTEDAPETDEEITEANTAPEANVAQAAS